MFIHFIDYRDFFNFALRGASLYGAEFFFILLVSYFSYQNYKSESLRNSSQLILIRKNIEKGRMILIKSDDIYSKKIIIDLNYRIDELNNYKKIKFIEYFKLIMIFLALIYFFHIF